MINWPPLREFPDREQHKLRWLLRHADVNGIVEAGVALKFGREWRINTDRLPDFLIEQTRQIIRGRVG